MTTTLVVGDVHGCAFELEQLIDKAQPNKTILVGDLFTKGPDPVGVWGLIQKYDMLAVMGNHDQWLVEQYSINPNHSVVKALNQSENDWYPWVKNLPLYLEEQGYIIVHAGIHPSGDIEKTTTKMALTMRRWPDETPQSLPWHESYQGKKGVIFGHDAKQGLVYKRENKRAFLVGLDTGCVYGKHLSGFIIETNELVHTKAQKIYCPIKTT